VLEDREVIDELRGLRAEGIFVGFSVTGAGQAETVRRALAVGIFDTVQATWNLIERSAGAALAEAHAAGIGVIVKETLANGRLTARGSEPLLADAAEELGTTPDALALAAVLAQPWADVVLSGATTVGQLQSNLAGLDLDVDGDLDRRLAPLVEEPAEYWSTRAGLPWN
jgi:aryl-alcohol dehydrogenase-like predicted oxidoreductase